MPPFSSNARKDKRDAVKRLLKIGSDYVCGICRKSYSNKMHAVSCLDRCANNFFAEQSALDKAKGNRIVYRCRYCCRSYESRASAMACVRACRLAMQKKFEDEHHDLSMSALVDLNKAATLTFFADKNLILEACAELLAQPKPHVSKPAKTKTYYCSDCMQVYHTSAQAIACENSHVAPLEATIVDDSETADSADVPGDENAMPELESFGEFEVESYFVDEQIPASTEEEPKSDVDPYYEKAVSLNAETEKQKYARKDARYECRACLERYFTKVEVLACFDKHLQGGPKSDQ